MFLLISTCNQTEVARKAAITPAVAYLPSAIVTPALGMASIFLQIRKLLPGAMMTIKLWETKPHQRSTIQKDFRNPTLACQSKALLQQLNCTMATRSPSPVSYLFLVPHRFPRRYSNTQWATSGVLRSLIFRKLHLSHPDRIEWHRSVCLHHERK